MSPDARAGRLTLLALAAGLLMASPAQPARAAEDAPPETIGTATMQPDGTIVLQLRAEDEARGIVGHGQLDYPPDHPDYPAILSHVGPLAPGETRPVAPWPDPPE